MRLKHLQRKNSTTLKRGQFIYFFDYLMIVKKEGLYNEITILRKLGKSPHCLNFYEIHET
jgi:hypothetical protein